MICHHPPGSIGPSVAAPAPCPHQPQASTLTCPQAHTRVHPRTRSNLHTQRSPPHTHTRACSWMPTNARSCPCAHAQASHSPEHTRTHVHSRPSHTCSHVLGCTRAVTNTAALRPPARPSVLRAAPQQGSPEAPTPPHPPKSPQGLAPLPEAPPCHGAHATLARGIPGGCLACSFACVHSASAQQGQHTALRTLGGRLSARSQTRPGGANAPRRRGGDHTEPHGTDPLVFVQGSLSVGGWVGGGSCVP